MEHPNKFGGYGVFFSSKEDEDLMISQGRKKSFKTADEAKAVAESWHASAP
jgi:hypothetical protein